MKKKYRLIILISLVLVFIMPSFGQEENTNEKNKSEKKEKAEKKDGWRIKPLPVISYDSDLGLQLGALVSFIDYGDGSKYPHYKQKIYFEASWFLKGSGIFRTYYDSDELIKGIRTTLDVTYVPDQLYKFFGFNGYEAVYNQVWEDDNNEDYKTRAYYRYKRKFLRTKLDFQGDIIGDNFKWLAGVDFYSFNCENVNIDHLNKGKSDDKQLPDTIGLYQQYINWNIIKPTETDGGMFTAFKLGLVYDSRDNEANPTRGLWSEIILVGAPKATSNLESGFSKLAITHRQYFTLVKNHLVFAYRLGFQMDLSGRTPFYAQGLVFTSGITGAYNEGLGGSSNLRGVQRNRVVGPGFVYGNFELRWKIAEFYPFNWGKKYIGLNGFFDTGRVIQSMDVESSAKQINDGLSPDNPEYVDLTEYFDFGAEKFHNAFGVGLYIGWDQNMIVSLDYGRALNSQDGKSGFYVGLNYLF